MRELEIINCIVIEDEENGRLVLQTLLKKYCPNVRVIGCAATIKEAIPMIIMEEPDLVFLDIELPEANGFTLFEHFPTNQFETIFVTAYSEYAIKALKLSALDYLLKPIDSEELVAAINKLLEKNGGESASKVNNLIANLNNGLSKIALPSNDGLIFVETDDIIRCESEGNYACVYFSNRNKFLISKTLAFLEEMLPTSNFFRVSRSSIINMNYVKKFHKGRKSIVELEDGTEISLPEIKKDEFMNFFNR